MKYKLQILIALLIVITNACNYNIQNTPIVSKTLPNQFNDTISDTLNIANTSWQSFFNDSLLTKLINEGLKNNLDLQATMQKINIARAEQKQAKGALFPTISANTTYWQRKFGDYTMDWAGNKVTEITPGKVIPAHLPDYYLGLQTNWEIDILGKLKNKKKGAYLRYLSSIEGIKYVKTNLISEIASNYYTLLSLDLQLDLVNENIKIQEDALNIIKIQKETANTTELAVIQFESQLLNSKALEFEINQQIIEVENRINYLLSRFPQKINRNKLSLNQNFISKLSIGVPSKLLSNRPDIKEAEFNVEASKLDVIVAKKAFYPSLNISGNIGLQAFNTAYLLSTPQSLAYNLIGNIAAPLINKSAIKANFSTANALQISNLCNYQSIIIKAFIEVNTQVAHISNLEKIKAIKNLQVDKLNKSIETSLELFKSGRANYLEILLTQSNSFETKLDLLATQQAQKIAQINLYKALGGGWK
ncbi:MAG: hypothetical protein RLZZ175_622 [Bacteroidota bacterium]|jgi:multidrug efflux system outer membrane protein